MCALQLLLPLLLCSVAKQLDIGAEPMTTTTACKAVKRSSGANDDTTTTTTTTTTATQ